MATINAIAATTAAILGLLEDAYGGEFGKLTFGPMQISDFAADKLPPDGVTLCLYHVAVNAARNRPPRKGCSHGPGRHCGGGGWPAG